MSDILYREVELPCTVREAWDFVVDPTWLGDEGDLDAVPGGEGWVRDGDVVHYLVVEEIDDERHVAYRWASFEEAPSRVEIDLEPTSEGTRISISESPLEARATARLLV